MAVAEIVLQYLQTLAWPLVVGGSLIYFRKPLSKKLAGLQSLRVPGAEADFERAAMQAATEAAESARASVQDEATALNTDEAQAPLDDGVAQERRRKPRRERAEQSVADRLMTARKTALEDPKRAIFEGYDALVDAAAIASSGAGLPHHEGFRRTVIGLIPAGLAPSWVSLATSLTELYNRVRHGEVENPSASSAASFVSAAEPLAFAMLNPRHAGEPPW